MNLESGVLQIHIEDIIPNRFQPRLNFDEQGLKELADSIKEHGIIQPLVLRKLGDKYEIIAGERRYKAAQMAGLQTVPAVIANIDDNKSAEVALVENVQRRDLTAIEEARSYKNLLDKGYLTQEQLAKRMGLSQPAIANKLRLLNLDEEVQQALLEERISERHARTLLQLPDKNAQKEWLHRIINERLTVRQLDEELKRTTGQQVIEEPVENLDETPLVENQPSLTEIKEQSMDLNDVRKAPVVNEPTLETSPNKFNMFNTDLTANESNTFTPTTVPDYNVTTPDNSNGFIPTFEQPQPQNEFKSNYLGEIPSYPTNMENDINRFNPIPESPKPDNSFFNQSTDLNTNNSNGLEVFDDPTAPKPSFVPTPEPEKKPMLNTFNNEQSTYTGSSSNKFFTPIIEDQPQTNFVQQEEKEIDPMVNIDRVEEASTEMDLKDAIEKIRETIQFIGDKGFYIEVEEIDFDKSYQITIQIHKDN